MNSISFFIQAKMVLCLLQENLINTQRTQVCHEIILTLITGNQYTISSGDPWSIDERYSLEWKPVRCFHSAIISQLRYLIGSILSELMFKSSVCEGDYMHFSSQWRDENLLFLVKISWCEVLKQLWFLINSQWGALMVTDCSQWESSFLLWLLGNHDFHMWTPLDTVRFVQVRHWNVLHHSDCYAPGKTIYWV